MPRKKLKKGFTTGAAAAAAAKAALISFYSHPPKQVEIEFLTGKKKTIQVHSVKKVTPNCVSAIIIKDAGDDPDVTHKAQIGVQATISEADQDHITIKGGKGVGKITKPGLELPVGEPAINPGPRKMIKHSIRAVFNQYNITNKHVEIEIFVPEGEKLTKKTLNERLGIIGGISILGTTGVVTPLSHDAYTATIKSGISVAGASGIDTLVFSTGRRSERYALGYIKHLPEEAFIQIGDFFKASLDMAGIQPGIQTIIYTVFFGKAVKMAMGFEHTHAAESKMTLHRLAGWAQKMTSDKKLCDKIESANTAREAFYHIYPAYPDLIAHAGKNIRLSAAKFCKEKFYIRVIIFDFQGNVTFDSEK